MNKTLIILATFCVLSIEPSSAADRSGWYFTYATCANCDDEGSTVNALGDEFIAQGGATHRLFISNVIYLNSYKRSKLEGAFYDESEVLSEFTHGPFDMRSEARRKRKQEINENERSWGDDNDPYAHIVHNVRLTSD